MNDQVHYKTFVCCTDGVIQATRTSSELVEVSVTTVFRGDKALYESFDRDANTLDIFDEDYRDFECTHCGTTYRLDQIRALNVESARQIADDPFAETP